MQKFFLRTMFVLTFLVGGMVMEAQAENIAPKKGVIRVKLQPEVALQVGTAPRMRTNGVVTTGIRPLDRAARNVKAVSIRPMLPYSAKFAKQRAKYGLDRWYVVTFDESVSSAEARKVFATTAGVELSEVVTPMSLKEGDKGFRKLDRSKVLTAPAATMPFNDPFLPQQWHYQNFGTIPYSVVGADINLFNAWKTSTGSNDVLVAIIDGGVDYTHEDLNQNMYVNTAELNGKEGVDDDGNGYVDDIYGWNFCTNEPKVYPHSHGTHVAGTVAAVNNNGIGVGGVAGGNGTPGSGVRMLSCQVFDSRSGTADGDFAAAIIYSAEKGATIAQCSWGWSSPEYKEQAVLDAIDYFTAEARSEKMNGGLCIFASGNDGKTGNYYPAAYSKCVAVTSMTSELTPASYSNYGGWADIIAPGGLLDYGEAQGVLSTLPGNEYGYNEGTSMATPHVSGIAALVLSRYGSPTFLNETLRTQLLTSVKDFYSYGNNKQYEGLYGSGYIDAAKALQMDETGRPESVKDFEIIAAQDYITLSWIIPASSDNNVNNHIIYYSKTPFTASDDLTKLPRVMVDTKFLNSGDLYTTEINNLDNLTEYYVAIQAVNRWGRASEISPVKSVTTNAGPKLSVDETELSMATDEANPVATSRLTINNEAEGVLKWEATHRTVSAQMKSARPMPGKVVPFAGKLSMKEASRRAVAAAPEYNADEYPKNMTWSEQLYAMIGETDKSLPNSMAQWFKVDPEKYPDGFNLTSLWVEAPTDGVFGANPKLEIYKGDVGISSASLIQEVDYMFFTYNYDIPLKEQIWFAPGESFWIVAHFDANQEGFPLCMGHTSQPDASSNNSYMSNDLGKTWVQLSTALKGSSYESMASEFVWAIRARSLNPDWSGVLELNPASGQVKKGEKQTVGIKVDGRNIVNGNYRFNINLASNETGNKVTKVPVTFDVSGNKPSVEVPKVVNFGNLLTGESKTMTVEVYNKGYGSFRGSEWGPGLYDGQNITSSSEYFSCPEGVSSGFPARATTKFELTYRPKSAGSHSGTITFSNDKGETVRIMVQGSATDPARLTVTPQEVEAGTLTLGEAPKALSFTITNDGKYPLEYVFPKFSSQTVEGAANLHKFGYAVGSTLEGYNEFAYEPAPELINPTDVTPTFNDVVYLTKPVALGFNFPFYGKSYDKVYITSFGGVLFAPNQEMLRGPLYEGSTSLVGTGAIMAYGRQLQMAPESKVEYGKKDGKFVINFKNVLALVYDKDYAPISFHMTLAPDGSVEIFYDEYNPGNMFQSGSSLYCGIADPDMTDCVTVTSSEMADYFGVEEPTADNSRYQLFGNGTAVKFEAPRALFVRSLEPAYGLVSPGESVEVKTTVGVSDDMNAGETYNNLTIVTNDPAPAISAVRFNAVISEEGMKPLAVVDNDNINFGKVFRTSKLILPVALKNDGHKAMKLTAAAFEKNSLTISNELPVEVKPGSSVDILVNVPTDKEGDVADKLTLTTDAGVLSVSVKGTVIGCPELGLSFDNINETLESGTPLTKTLEISNNGNEPLEYAFSTDENVKVAVPEKENSEVSYVYGASVDNKAEYDWVDIVDNGLGEQNPYRYYMNHDYIEVELPFEFPFYGKKYNKMYVYNTGFVSFTERRDDKIWPEPPGDFPAGTVFHNIIAPYWGLHSMNTTKTGGTYHYVTEDRAVVSFMEYGNSMNYGVCYQLIMEKNGSFKFQYKGYDENSNIMSAFGLAGTCNEDATDAIRLPERYIAFGNAVTFTPVIKNTMAPGEKEEVAITVNTDRMAGDYQSTISIATNVPSKETVEIPVSVTVTGEAKPVIADEVNVENVLGYRSMDMSDPMVQQGMCYSAYFSVANEGSAEFQVTGVNYESPMIEDPMFGEFPAFMLLAKLPELDWITGEPTGKYAWQIVEPDFFMPQTVGKAPLEFAVPMQECEFWMTPGTYEIPVTISYTANGEPKQKTVNVKFTVTPAPAMVFDKEEIRIANAADDHNSVETLKITNEGEYKLDYSFYLDPSGVGETVEDTGGGIAPTAFTKALAANGEVSSDLYDGMLSEIKAYGSQKDANPYELPTNFDYTNALYYESMPGNNAAYNYGANNLFDVYKEAVSFKAPKTGINISHIYIPVLVEDAKNVNVKIELLTGSTPEDNGDVIGRGNLFIESQPQHPETGAYTGQFYVVPLEKPVYMNPDEEFNVVVTYPEGLKIPSYLCVKEEPVKAGRYLGWTENAGWYDVSQLFEDQYGSIGYILTCLETVPGEPWVSLATEETEGELAVGASKEIKIKINAAAARLEKNNKAVIVIKSNDPDRSLVNYPVYLDKNGAPVIGAPSGKIYAKEGQTTNVPFTVFDEDGDDITLKLADSEGIASISEVTPSEGDNITVDKAEDGTVTVKGATMPVNVNVALTPAFGQEGSYIFTLVAADNAGHTSVVTQAYEVENVNRAPEAEGDLDITVKLGELSKVTEFATIFTDPDGDEMTYSFNFPANAVADAFTTPTGVVFHGRSLGTASGTITATDSEGLSASVKVNVTVSDNVGIDELTAGDGLISLSASAFHESLNFKSLVSGNLSAKVYDAAGQCVHASDLDVAAGNAYSIALGGNANGVYILHVTSAGKTETYRFIKR
ncbi:choice-of-anchor D domain-containing protein [Palleniella muris]|uniref:Choice-of-anchor D domain-containing protein n=1 Tax=Palleniella muris TaxID=3038145 RepID=A0AC61QSH3_9BACT|nr:S8 family serine peptidase [Palleniella muris]TGX83156.1 choice-of-anchor D domain-containing protein [Palleniella muris]